jgi:site-specific recombinase XerD
MIVIAESYIVENSPPTLPGAQALAQGPQQTPGALARIATFDADTAVVEPGGPLQPNRPRRGRPRKALTELVLDTDQITADDMAWLRAWVLGVPAARAGRHYACSDVAGDGRSARGYLHRLLARLRRAAGELREREQAIAYVEEFLQPLPLADPAPPASVGAAARVPTLEEFAQRFDPDMYTEAELIALFQDEYGAPAAASAAPKPAPTPATKSARQIAIERKFLILDWLGPRVALAPSAASPLSAWIGKQLAQAITAHLRVGTLSELAAWINAQGRWWYRQVPGLGRARAERLVLWLADHAEAIGVAIERRVMKTVSAPQPTGAPALGGVPTPRQEGALAVPASPGGALVPLEQLLWPPALLGEAGQFRAHTPNTMGARNDCDAVVEWLRRHLAGKSEATQLVYRRAIERLVLWALLERRCALSSLTARDLAGFREFLYEPPVHWCGDDRVMKYSEDWRPLRGPLSETAVRQVLGVIKTMFHAWHVSGYLFADAADGVGWRSERKRQPAAQTAQASDSATVTMDVNRSFVKEDLEAMRRTLDELQDGPARRRLRAILLLLLTTGMRRSEPVRLSFGMIEPVREGNQLTGTMKIGVLGKGRKVRELPLKAVTLDALDAHYQDRMALVAAGALPERFAQIPKEQTPLLSILREVRPSGSAGAGDSTSAAARRVNFDGRLDGSSIYAILKDFFERVGKRDDLVHGQAAFSKASTHWMRHTFAHVGLAEGGSNSLPTIQALLGHSNIATTGLYLKANMGDRVRMVEAIEAVF